MANLPELTDANFEVEVLQSPVPVLVDFWAPWCGPCQQIAPSLEQIAVEYAGRLKVAKYNVDVSNAVAAQHGIRSIPTLFLFKNGEVAARLMGALPKSEIAKRIDEAL